MLNFYNFAPNYFFYVKTLFVWNADRNYKICQFVGTFDLTDYYSVSYSIPRSRTTCDTMPSLTESLTIKTRQQSSVSIKQIREYVIGLDGSY